jgi:hypothetical protein
MRSRISLIGSDTARMGIEIALIAAIAAFLELAALRAHIAGEFSIVIWCFLCVTQRMFMAVIFQLLVVLMRIHVNVRIRVTHIRNEYSLIHEHMAIDPLTHSLVLMITCAAHR